MPISHDVKYCLEKEMKISLAHFYSKYFSFSNEIQNLIDNKLLEMLEVSHSIKDGNTSEKDFNKLFYQDGDHLTNDFLQVLFDCFREWQTSEGVELQKNLYIHQNRSTDNWFPLVIIDKQINQCGTMNDFISVFRGCSKDEFDTNVFQQRQSWTTNFNVAKLFAFSHPPQSTNLKNRIVIKALVKNCDILWDIGLAESEIVLRLDFTPKSESIVMTYNDYLQEHK